MIQFALLVLAGWRITSLLSREDGPFDIFARLRYWIGVRYDEYSQPTVFKNTLAKGIVCVWCLSMWTSFVLAFFSPFTTNIISYIINWWGISALVILINEVIDLIARADRR